MSKPLHPVLKRLLRRAYANGLSNLELISQNAIPESHHQNHQDNDIVRSERFTINHTLSCQIFSPKDSKKALPALMYFPASGWIFNRQADSEAFCRYLAQRLHYKIVLPELMLAPKRQFLGLLDDGLALCEWLEAEAKSLQIEPGAIDAWGESSGAHLLATISHQLQAQQKSTIRHQVLVYPIVDFVNDYPSKSAYKKGYLIDTDLLQHLFQQMMDPTLDFSDPLLTLVRQHDFTHLPETTVITAEYDPLRDEASLYVKKLKEAGIKVNHQQFDGMIHGFLRFANKLEEANAALTFACDKILQTR